MHAWWDVRAGVVIAASLALNGFLFRLIMRLRAELGDLKWSVGRGEER